MEAFTLIANALFYNYVLGVILIWSSFDLAGRGGGDFAMHFIRGGKTVAREPHSAL